MNIILSSFAIAIILAIAFTVLCTLKNKTDKTKAAIIITGIMCYFVTCFSCGLIAGC